MMRWGGVGRKEDALGMMRWMILINCYEELSSKLTQRSAVAGAERAISLNCGIFPTHLRIS